MNSKETCSHPRFFARKNVFNKCEECGYLVAPDINHICLGDTMNAKEMIESVVNGCDPSTILESSTFFDDLMADAKEAKVHFEIKSKSPPVAMVESGFLKKIEQFRKLAGGYAKFGKVVQDGKAFQLDVMPK